MIAETRRPKCHPSLSKRKEPRCCLSYLCHMTCRNRLCWLNITATVLVVLGMLTAGLAQAAMPVGNALTAVEICHGDDVVTIYVDADGNEKPAPDDCANCPACAFSAPVLPVGSRVGLRNNSVVALPFHATQGIVCPFGKYVSPPVRGPPLQPDRIASA